MIQIMEYDGDSDNIPEIDDLENKIDDPNAEGHTQEEHGILLVSNQIYMSYIKNTLSTKVRYKNFFTPRYDIHVVKYI